MTNNYGISLQLMLQSGLFVMHVMYGVSAFENISAGGIGHHLYMCRVLDIISAVVRLCAKMLTDVPLSNWQCQQNYQ